MLKFYIVEEDGKQHVMKFEGLREFHKWERKHYISFIKTLDLETIYTFENLAGVKVAG